MSADVPRHPGSIMVSSRSEAAAWIRDQIDRTTFKEFGHIPVIRETVWASPDWHVAFISDSMVLSFLSIVERCACFDGNLARTAGIANVITREGYRHSGFGTAIMQRAHAFMSSFLNAKLGLLLCSEDVIPFYSRLGWTRTSAVLRFDQPFGSRLWGKDVLIYSPQGEAREFKNIDLRGLPW